MADGENILFRPRVRLWLESIHPHVHIATVSFILKAHPILEGRPGDFVDRADTLDDLTTLPITQQHSDAVGRMEIRADIFGGRESLLATGWKGCYGRTSFFCKMTQQSKRSVSGLYPLISRTSETNRCPGRRSI